jgi:hypothetical protein
MILRMWLVSYWSGNPRTAEMNLVRAATADEARARFARHHGREKHMRNVHARVVPERELDAWDAWAYRCVNQLCE